MRRGALRRFHKLKQETQELPVEVTWDRRTEDRRATPPDEAVTDRRTSDRRRKPSFTWELADFVVVPGSETDAGDDTDSAEPQATQQPIPEGVELGPRPLEQRARRKSR